MMKYAPLALLLVLAACGKQPDDATTSNATTSNEVATASTAADPNAPPAAFAQCMTCHSVTPGEKGLGPNLHGVVGRKSGAQEGFFYSSAMTAANLTWDEATLDKYIEKPMVVVPGNRMSYAGQSDAAKRAAIIAWLKKNS